MPNIKDIAKAAGVSTSTVSRVLNNNQRISPETREHVMNIMHEHNYVPNAMARGLSTQKANSVALLVNIEDKASFDNLFFHKVMYGIENVLYKNDMTLVISNLQTPRGGKSRLVKMIQGKQIQGLVLPSFILTPEIIKTLKELNFPFVAFGEPENSSAIFDWVDVNNQQGGKQATEHLIDAGYKRIAFLSGSISNIHNQNRLSGYKAMLNNNKICVDESYIAQCDSSKEGAATAMLKLLELPSHPDAVICGDNVISVGAMKAIAKKGLKIPRDIGVVSFDNLPIAELVEPNLTTVDIDVFAMGAEAANILLRKMKNLKSNTQVSLISTSIQIRESTLK